MGLLFGKNSAIPCATTPGKRREAEWQDKLYKELNDRSNARQRREDGYQQVTVEIDGKKQTVSVADTKRCEDMVAQVRRTLNLD